LSELLIYFFIQFILKQNNASMSESFTQQICSKTHLFRN